LPSERLKKLLLTCLTGSTNTWSEDWCMYTIPVQGFSDWLKENNISWQSQCELSRLQLDEYWIYTYPDILLTGCTR
jgi:hypothetical protein